MLGLPHNFSSSLEFHLSPFLFQTSFSLITGFYFTLLSYHLLSFQNLSFFLLLHILPNFCSIYQKKNHGHRTHHLLANRRGRYWGSDRFYSTFLGSMITADGDSSHEIKRHLFLGRKALTYLDSILKSGDITLPIKVRLV